MWHGSAEHQLQKMTQQSAHLVLVSLGLGQPWLCDRQSPTLLGWFRRWSTVLSWDHQRSMALPGDEVRQQLKPLGDAARQQMKLLGDAACQQLALPVYGGRQGRGGLVHDSREKDRALPEEQADEAAVPLLQGDHRVPPM